MKSLLFGFGLACLLFFCSGGSMVFAQEGESEGSGSKTIGVIPGDGELGKKIQDGTVSLSDIPLVIVHLIDLITKIAGTIAVGFLIYGGFLYVASGLTEKKDDAKNTIRYAIIGLVVSLLAWKIVDVIQTNLTS